MLSSLTIKGECAVKPASKTFTGQLPLSELDQTLAYVPTLYFYRPTEKWIYPPEKIIDTFRNSLSLALVHYHSLSDRLRWSSTGKRLELDCNGAGARFVEAESEASLEDYGDFRPNRDFTYLIPSVDYKKGLHENPLLHVQVTRFKCGGVSLGLVMSHAITDGFGAFEFIGEWARIARGEKVSTEPCVERVALRAGEPPTGIPRFDHRQFDDMPLIVGETDAEKERAKKTTISMLTLNPSQVENIKRAANESIPSGTRPYSTYESVTAHVWRSMCKSRPHVADQETRLGICVDFRRRVNPPLPKGFFGNAALNVAAIGKSGEIQKQPLGIVCERIRQAIRSVSEEYVWSSIDFMKSQPDLSRFQDLEGLDVRRPFYGNPNLRVTSWLTLPVYGKDFGWGNEIHMGLGTHDIDGDTLIMPSQLGDGSLVIACCMQVENIKDFKTYFHDDVTSYKKFARQDRD